MENKAVQYLASISKISNLIYINERVVQETARVKTARLKTARQKTARQKIARQKTARLLIIEELLFILISFKICHILSQ